MRDWPTNKEAARKEWRRTVLIQRLYFCLGFFYVLPLIDADDWLSVAVFGFWVVLCFGIVWGMQAKKRHLLEGWPQATADYAVGRTKD